MYWDPAFGGTLLQIAVALVATGGAIIFAMRRKIKALFSKDKANENIISSAVDTVGAIDSSDDDAIDMLTDGNKNE